METTRQDALRRIAACRAEVKQLLGLEKEELASIKSELQELVDDATSLLGRISYYERCTCGQHDSDTLAWYGDECPQHGKRKDIWR